jgi:hypothetical protein
VIAEDQRSITYEFKDGRCTTAFVYADWWRRVAPELAAEVDMDSEVVERRLLLAHEVGSRDWLDGLVMPLPSALAERWRSVWLRAPVLTAEEAAALSGLFLRAHGDFTIEYEYSTAIHATQEDFYRIGAGSLLPSASLWLYQAMELWRSSGSPALFGLVDAVLVRLGRALKARDYLQVRGRAPDRDAAWSDVLFFFESVLVALQGSLDAAARFLHLRYALDGSPRGANWGKRRWRRRLVASSAPTRAFENERLSNLDVLVGELRNSIHGEVLSHELRQNVEVGRDPLFASYMRTGIVLEPALAGQVARAAELEGGVTRWLHQTWPEGTALIDPWLYAEAALSATVSAVRSIADAVAADAGAEEVPPLFEKLWTGTQTQQANARLLFGVGVLPRP